MPRPKYNPTEAERNPMTRPKHVSVPTNRERATWGHGDGVSPLVDCLVDADHTVWAYDEIAGYYTLHHSLPAEVVAEARRLAEVSAAEGGVMAGWKIGQAIARDVIADGLDRRWSGIDAQDADHLTAIGLEPGTPEWAEAEEAARVAYEAEIAAAAEGGDS